MERSLKAVEYQIEHSRETGRVLKLAILCQLIFACSQNLSTPASPEMSDFVHAPQIDISNTEGHHELDESFRVVSGRDFVTFGPGSAALSSAAKFTLERQALWLNDNPEVRAQIVGFADRGKSSGKDAALAARRAQVVRDYLLLNKVSESQLSIVGVDSLPQLASNNESAGRALTVIVG